MEVTKIFEITFDESNPLYWLCADSLKIVLEFHCTNTNSILES